MSSSIIISTYNSPSWLEKVLVGFEQQTNQDFEIIVADDGSTHDTKLILDKYRPSFQSLSHVWHDDQGFRKCEILNKAIVASNTPYLIFTDGDCIPRKDFVDVHLKSRQEGCFLSGGYFKLPMEISESITFENIRQQNCFDIRWLKREGLPSSFKNNKLSENKHLLKLLNKVTPTNPTWNGHNASGWKEDILSVNGFDERMKYGGEDRELGERLENRGIKGLQIRYKAICVHLDHSRSYVNQHDLDNNDSIRSITKKQALTWTSYGIIKKPPFPPQ